MIRGVIRSFLFAFGAVYLAQRFIGGLQFGGNYTKTLVLVVVAVALLHMFMMPVLRVLSLPDGGIGFLLLNIFLTFVILYVLTVFIDDFSIVKTTMTELRFLDNVLPSRELGQTMAALYSSVVIGLTYHFAEWLCDKR